MLLTLQHHVWQPDLLADVCQMRLSCRYSAFRGEELDKIESAQAVHMACARQHIAMPSRLHTMHVLQAADGAV